MRAHGSRSQQEPVANGDLNIDNIINANIGGFGARYGNDLSRRSRLGPLPLGRCSSFCTHKLCLSLGLCLRIVCIVIRIGLCVGLILRLLRRCGFGLGLRA